MDNKATVQAVMDAVQSGNFAAAIALLSPDFQFSGGGPQPFNAAAWLGFSASLLKAFPDLNYRFKIEGEEGNLVLVYAQQSGTHHGDLDLTALGMTVFPPTHKSFSTTAVRSKVTVSDGKVVSSITEPTEGSGAMAVLKELGSPTP